MATLPDDTFFGTSPSDEQRAFWLSDGTMQSGVQSGGDADAPVWTDGAAPSDTLKQAQADAEYLTKVLDAQRAMREANDPADVRAYEPVLRAATEARAAVFENPAYGHLWQRERDAETKQWISTRFDEVSREQTLANTDAWLNQLKASALQGSGDEAVRLIDTGARLIQGLKDGHHIDEAAAQAKQRHWVQNYAAAWIERRPAQERLALLGEAPSADTVAPEAGAAAYGNARGTGTPADFLPPEERARVLREAQVEIDRLSTEQIFARTRHYEDGFDRALNDGAPLPSRDDIVFDPALDVPSRERLQQRRETAAQELENYAWFRQKFDDPNAGSFDRDDPDTRKFLDRIYKSRGGDEAALYTVVNRTGVVPEAAHARMQGDLASDDPVRVGRALEQLAGLAETHPDARLLQNDGEELQYALTQFRYATSRGDAPEQAIRGIIAQRSPDFRENSKSQSDTAAEVAKATSPSDLAHLVDTNPIIAAALFSVYPELVKDRLAATRDISLAKAQALDQAKLLVEVANDTDINNAVAASSKDAGSESISLKERERLSELMAYFDTPWGMMQFARWMEVKPSVEAGLKDDELIKKHTSGLNTRGQEARRQATLEYFRKIPELYDAAMADRAKYDAMPPASTLEEFNATAWGYAKGSAFGVDKLFAPSRLARLLMMSSLRNKLPISGPSTPGSIGTGVPQTAGWWQMTSPAQVQQLNNDALRAGMVIAGAPPLQPTPDGVIDRGGRSSAPAAQPGRPFGDDPGLPLPPPVAAPWDPTRPTSRPLSDSSAQTKADEKEEEEKWGVYFFAEGALPHIDRDDATLGQAGKPLFYMPYEDSSIVVDAASAYKYTGGAPSIEDAYRHGKRVFGVKFPLKDLPSRLPRAGDSTLPHYLTGGHTALRLHDNGAYLINPTREFVIEAHPLGREMPKGSEMFELHPDGVRELKRKW